MAPIVLDSYYFEPNLKDSKWTDQDLAIFNYLLKIAEVDGKEYFDKLYNAISNVELNLKLGIHNLLIKDFKTYFLLQGESLGIGVSSTFVPMHTLLEHFTVPTITDEMEQLMKAKTLGMFGIMSNSCEYEDKQYHKQLLLFMNSDICSADVNHYHKFIEFLESYEDFRLKDKKVYDLGNGRVATVWEIGNTKYSRKNMEALMN